MIKARTAHKAAEADPATIDYNFTGRTNSFDSCIISSYLTFANSKYAIAASLKHLHIELSATQHWKVTYHRKERPFTCIQNEQSCILRCVQRKRCISLKEDVSWSVCLFVRLLLVCRSVRTNIFGFNSSVIASS